MSISKLIKKLPLSRNVYQWAYGKVMALHESAQRKILQEIPKYELTDQHCAGILAAVIKQPLIQPMQLWISLYKKNS